MGKGILGLKTIGKVYYHWLQQTYWSLPDLKKNHLNKLEVTLQT